jgi:hypothetical protein
LSRSETGGARLNHNAKEPDRDVRDQVSETLSSFGQDGSSSIIEALQSENSLIRGGAATTIGEMEELQKGCICFSCTLNDPEQMCSALLLMP